MNNFFKIFKFSFHSQVKAKSFIISTVIFALLISICLSIPSIINAFKSSSEDQPGGNSNNNAEKKAIAIIDKDRLIFENTEDISQYDEGKYGWSMQNLDADVINEKIENGEFYAAVYVRDEKHADIISKINMNAFSQDEPLYELVSQYAKDVYRMKIFEKYDISEDIAAEAYIDPVIAEIKVGENDAVAGMLHSYLFVIVLYMTILMYGMMVATSVAQEKSSRAMEILVTAAKPETLMFGKVLGVGLAGLCQLAAVIAVSFLAYLANQDSLMSIDMLKEILSISPEILILLLVFFILGYFLYAMVYSAIGSLVSRTEELQSSVAPMTFLTMFGFFTAI